MSLVNVGEYHRVPELIVSAIPEFAESPELARLRPDERVLPGLVCGAFADFLTRVQSEALSGPGASAIVDRCYGALERLASSTDPAVRNVVVVEILENLDGSVELMTEFRRHLQPNSRMLFEVWIERRGN